MTDLNDSNEPFTASTNTPKMQRMNTFFGNFMVETSIVTNPEQQSELVTCTQSTILPNVSNMDDESHIWSLYFDGSKSKEGVGVGCVLIDPIGNKKLITFRLEFECTNNTVEYEALLQGLKKEVDMNVQNIMVFGDSEIVVRQVRNSIHCLSPHLKSYQAKVWNLMHNFFAFNIKSIPILSNYEVDLLSNIASKLFPAEGLSPNTFSIELLFRPLVPDNITNWRVLDDDQQIISFLHMEDTF